MELLSLFSVNGPYHQGENERVMESDGRFDGPVSVFKPIPLNPFLLEEYVVKSMYPESYRYRCLVGVTR